MKLNLLLSSQFALVLMITACGQQTRSQLDGHYEDENAASMTAYRGQQAVPPEYAASDAVIVSLELMNIYEREDLVKAVMDTGVNKVWITVNRDSGQNLQSSAFSRLRQVLGTKISKVAVVEQKDSGQVTVWARDWSPLGSLTEDGTLRLLDLNYYPRRPADDATGRSFAGLTGIERISVPVYNEGGNFMTNSRGECLMSTRVTDANADVYKAGDMVLDADQIKEYYRDFAGCRSTTIFPRLPTETTGHIDMWSKFVDDDTVLVGQISEETLAFATSGNRAMAKQIQGYLNDRAADIAELGYRVIRIPMPLPSPSLYRSYTNSLLLNGIAIIPQYVSGNFSNYSDQTLISTYETKVRQIYEAMGYKAVFIPSDAMISSGGAVHCVTMQIPTAN